MNSEKRPGDLFASLPPPPAGEAVLSAAPIVDYERFRVAKDAENRALFLVREDAGQYVAEAPLSLTHLRVERGRRCRVRYADGLQEFGRFTVLSCLSSDPALRSHFLLLVEILAEHLGDAPSGEALEKALASIVELFRALQHPPRKTVQGLWAEVFVIYQARRPAVLLESWHVKTEGCFDFSLGPERIEVKSATGNPRQHHFMLEQLMPPAGTNVLIASMFVNRVGGGTSIDEFLRSLGDRPDVDSGLLLRAQGVVAATLGESLQTGLAEKFDLELARHSLAFYPAEVIPRVPNPPVSVTDVRFRADLSGVTATAVGQIASGSTSLFGAAAAVR